MPHLSQLTKGLSQSGIRKASTRCREIGGINLGQGICDIPIHNDIKEAASRALFDNKNIYGACEGLMPLREKVTEKISNFNGFDVCPKTETMITHGATGAFVTACKTLFNPGDKVILFEPFYGYHLGILSLLGIGVKTSPIHIHDFSLDFDHLESLIDSETKAIVICTPNNPTGKVYQKEELEKIASLANQYDLTLITDEIYEYITYEGQTHISIASLDKETKERTITISGLSKTFNMTGWRLGYATGPKHIIEKMALVQDLFYVCPAAPLQHAALTAMSMGEDYYEDLKAAFVKKRAQTIDAVTAMGLQFSKPQGAYYIFADVGNTPLASTENLAQLLLEEAKVATVDGSAFYLDASQGQHQIRLCYALSEDKLAQAFSMLNDFFQRQ